jgi:hypothetical protein
MKPQMLQYKKTGLALLSSFLLLVSFNAAAQKSVYDVIPGSGPKKQRTTNSNSRVIIIDGRRNDDRVYTGRRTNLPPGIAKKVYGGSARDYAPGQLKKRERYNDGRWDRDNDNRRNWKHKKHWKH